MIGPKGKALLFEILAFLNEFSVNLKDEFFGAYVVLQAIRYNSQDDYKLGVCQNYPARIYNPLQKSEYFL